MDLASTAFPGARGMIEAQRFDALLSIPSPGWTLTQSHHRGAIWPPYAMATSPASRHEAFHFGSESIIGSDVSELNPCVPAKENSRYDKANGRLPWMVSNCSPVRGQQVRLDVTRSLSTVGGWNYA